MKRITSISRKIVKILRECSYPLSVPEINKKIKAHKTTLYRQIESMVRDGLLNKYDFGDGVIRYESVQNGHHHHLVCTKCKSVEGIEIGDDFSKEEKFIFDQRGFVVMNHALEFFGFCANCYKIVKEDQK